MALKKPYGNARAFTEGHREVLGDQSEVSNPSPKDPTSAKTKAVYAKQRAYNAQPWSVRKGNDIHASDPNKDFTTRLAEWETARANRGNDIHGSGNAPKPVDLGRDRGGNWYKPYQAGSGGQGGAPRGTMAGDRIDQTRWTGVSDASAAEAQRTGEAPKTGRDGSPLSRTEQLRNDRIKNKTLTRREQEDKDRFAAQQPYANNERREGIQGNFGSLGNFFNDED